MSTLVMLLMICWLGIAMIPFMFLFIPMLVHDKVINRFVDFLIYTSLCLAWPIFAVLVFLVIIIMIVMTPRSDYNF